MGTELHRPYIRKSTREMLDHNAQLFQSDKDGNIHDPNSGRVLNDSPVNAGHHSEMENRGIVDFAQKSGMSQKELNNTCNNAGLYQIEGEKENKSHQYESKDKNQTALTTANYCYLENPNYQENTYINPPEHGNTEWTVSTINKNTDIEYTIGTFNPDLGEITTESNETIQNTESSAIDYGEAHGSDMSDFGKDTDSHTEMSAIAESNNCADVNGIAL